MTFLTIDKDVLFSFIDDCYKNKHYAVQIILTNGQFIVGHIHHQKHEYTCEQADIVNSSFRLIPSSEQCFYNDCLILSLSRPLIEIETEKLSIIEKNRLLDINQIAGISVIDFEQPYFIPERKALIQEKNESLDYPGICDSIDKLWESDPPIISLPATNTAFDISEVFSTVQDDEYIRIFHLHHTPLVLNCYITGNGGLGKNHSIYSINNSIGSILHIDQDTPKEELSFSPYSLHAIDDDKDLITNGIRWGRAEPKNDTNLYADWEFLSRISNNINSIGAGIPLANVSFGWENSLWKTVFVNTDRENVIALKDAKYQYFGTFQGHIEFLKANNVTTGKPVVQYVEMENAKWIPALIKEDTYANEPDDSWGIVYFRYDRLALPIEAWPAFDKSITVFGEVIHVPMETKYGNVSFFIKARAAVLYKNL